MLNFVLIREDRTADANFGRLINLSNGDQLRTLELPWDFNRSGMSCIPEGAYQCVKHAGQRFPDTFCPVNHKLNVYHWPGTRMHDWQRYACVFHAANRPSELEGCIALGMDAEVERGVLVESNMGMAEFRKWTEGVESFNLWITS